MTVLDLPLRGQAVYNPHLLSKQELIEAFSARQGLLDRLLESLRSTPPGRAQQHHLLVGQRGMGKTMLLRRLRYAVEDDPELAATWLALTFPEEQYNVAALSDFWLNCLDALSDLLEHLGEAAGAAGLDETVEAIRHADEENARSGLALSALLERARALGRRLVLLVDNADLVFDRIGEQDWSLREALSAQPDLVFLGASAALIESTYEYGRAFYDFFQVHELAGLSLDETRALLLHTASSRGDRTVAEIVEGEPARVKTLHNLTGGNPRTLVLLYNVLATGAEGDVRSDLEQLLDHCTPLYKARFEALPAQAQQVVHALALRWDPTSAGELAEDLRLEVNAVSSQLNRLARQGLVEKVPYDPDSKTGFQIGERFFNIWYLMRASRRVRARLIFLVRFLRMFYRPDDLRGKALRHAENLASTAVKLAPDNPFRAHTLACILARRGKWKRATEAAATFLTTWSGEMPEGVWPDVLAFFREAVAAAKAREAADFLDRLDLSDRWRPLREAVEVLARGDRNSLRRVAPEIRKPAEEILEQLSAPAEDPEPGTRSKKQTVKSSGAQRSRKPVRRRS